MLEFLARYLLIGLALGVVFAANDAIERLRARAWMGWPLIILVMWLLLWPIALLAVVRRLLTGYRDRHDLDS